MLNTYIEQFEESARVGVAHTNFVPTQHWSQITLPASHIILSANQPFNGLL